MELAPDLASRYVAYKVTCRSPLDPTLAAAVRRRYRDFVHLHATLGTTFALPPKTYFYALGGAFVARRQHALHAWLENVVARYCVLRHAPLRAFLGLDAWLAAVLPDQARPANAAPTGAFAARNRRANDPRGAFASVGAYGGGSLAGLSLAEGGPANDAVADAAEAARAALAGEWPAVYSPAASPAQPPSPPPYGATERRSLQRQSYSAAERASYGGGNGSSDGGGSARSRSEAPRAPLSSSGRRCLHGQPPGPPSEPAGDFWERASQQHFSHNPEAALHVGNRTRGQGQGR